MSTFVDSLTNYQLSSLIYSSLNIVHNNIDFSNSYIYSYSSRSSFKSSLYQFYKIVSENILYPHFLFLILSHFSKFDHFYKLYNISGLIISISKSPLVIFQNSSKGKSLNSHYFLNLDIQSLRHNFRLSYF